MRQSMNERVPIAEIFLLLGLSLALLASAQENCSGRQRLRQGSQGGAAGRRCDDRLFSTTIREDPVSFARVPLTTVRSIDGSGENEQAQSGAVLLRLTESAYPDGHGQAMAESPSARLISNVVANINNTMMESEMMLNQEGSLPSDMVWIWGQFLDHDLSLSEVGDENSYILSPDCDSDVLCMIPFTRSQFVLVDGVREQINAITGLIDASMVYGSDENLARALRAFQFGLLRVSDGNMLPYNEDAFDNRVPDGSDPTRMSLAGDVRVNEQVGLTAMHTIFLREHNRIAMLLFEVFREPNDENLYQMARKIIGALIQRITYNEFLPVLLGPDKAPKLENHTGYDPSVNPAIATEFSTVAFRVGHTMLSPTLRMQDQAANISLVDAFFNPDMLLSEPNNIDYLLAGFCHQSAQSVDTLIVDEVRNFLFGHPVAGVGHDLASLNIQRGRDHGIGSYNELRVGFGLQAATSFADISSNPAVQQALSEAYGGELDLVDAWVGGLAENHVPGGMVGELFATIICDQFTRLMFGDPFFYLEDKDLMDPVLVEKVIDVSTATLADVLDAHSDLFDFSQDTNVFLAGGMRR